MYVQIIIFNNVYETATPILTTHTHTYTDGVTFNNNAYEI